MSLRILARAPLALAIAFAVLVPSTALGGTSFRQQYGVAGGVWSWMNADPPPPLTVSKTAIPSFAVTYDWDITKSVDGDPQQGVAPGGTATFDYTVSVHPVGGAPGDWTVSGFIAVSNKLNADVTVSSIDDEVDNGGNCTVDTSPGLTLSALGGMPYPYSCTYGPNGPSPLAGTNKVTVRWDAQTLSDGTDLAAGEASSSETFDFAEADAHVVGGSVQVSDPLDDQSPRFVSFDDPADLMSYSYSHDFPSGPAGTCTEYDNTASMFNDSVLLGTDGKTVKVCTGADLTVSKTATSSFTRTFPWTITKSAAPDDITSPTGSGTFDYTVAVTKLPAVDTAFAVKGTITVTNPNDWEDISANLSDSLAGCTFDQAMPITVPKSGSVTVGYTCPSDGTNGTNTATASWDKGAFSTTSNTATASADYAFGDPTTTVNDSIHVDDTNGQSWLFGDSGSRTYSVTHEVAPGTCESFDNTATITETGLSADKTVRLCAGAAVAADLTVSKTATASFTRTYDWTIDKSVASPTRVEQSGGGTATFAYSVNAAGHGYTDSGWVVAGKITVTNPNDSEAITADVTDAVDNGGLCTVTDGTGVSIPAGSSVTLDYSCSYDSAPSPAGGTNTATATWDGSASHTPAGSASGTANVAFTDPTSEVNKTITVTDTFNNVTDTLGTVTYPGPGTFSYSRTVNVPTWDCVTYPNTATIVETGQSAGASVTVCGPARTGALTMGFWQNKNGQAIITAANQPALRTYLTGFAPFQDIGTTAVNVYATTVIKAASASGASMNAMLKAQMLATALDVYFGGGGGGNPINAPVAIGNVVIDLTNVSPIGNTSAAFGGATCLSVSDILSYASTKSNAGGGVWYANVKTTQELAKDVFDAINNQWAFSCQGPQDA